MSTPASGPKPPVDYGVQIRFIKDLRDAGGGGSVSSSAKHSSSRYGVAVRVQGIAGQPYVVLKEGEKGDSYGVQLRSQPCNTPPAYSSLPRSRDDCPAHGLRPSLMMADSSLRRAQSHGSLLDKDGTPDNFGHVFRCPPRDGHSGSYGSLDVGASSQPDSIRWGGSLQAGLNGLLEGATLRGGSYCASSEPAPDDGRMHAQAAPAASRLTPVNSPISRFSGGATGPRQAPAVGGSTRGSSPTLDSASRLHLASSAPPTAINAYSSPLPASLPASACGSRGRGSGSVAMVSALPSSGLVNVDAHVTPDLLMDQGQSSGAELANEEDQMLHTIYGVLRQWSNESNGAVKRRARVICEKIQQLPGNRVDSVLKEELEHRLEENLHLQEQLSRKKTELDHTHSEMAQLRMERENVEGVARSLEDQLAGLQEELQRERDSRAQSAATQTEVLALRTELTEAALRTELTEAALRTELTEAAALRTELTEAAALQQKQEDALRQRERELTALKGALKEEVSTHDREVETLREQYSQDMEKLRASMEQVSQSQATIEAERQRVNSTVRSLQQQLEDNREEAGHWRGQLQTTREELRNTKQELLQVRMEKEEVEEELKELQERLNIMKQQMSDIKHSQTIDKELELCRAGLKQTHAEVEKLKGDLDKKTMEIISLKRTNQELEAEQKYEIDRLKNQSRRDKEELTKVQEKAKLLADPSLVQSLRGELSVACGEAEQLSGKLILAEEDLQKERACLGSAQTLIQTLTQEQEGLEETNTRLKEKVARLESQLQAQASQTLEAEQELQEETRRLQQQLEEAKRSIARLGQHRDELSRTLEDRDREKDALRKDNMQLNEEKRQHEKILDKLNKEMEKLSVDSSQSVQSLQTQLSEQRDRWRREQQDLQKVHKEKLGELERAQISLRSLQEDFARQKKELMGCCEERDNSTLDRELLVNRLCHLEAELESQRSVVTDRARDMRSMEDKVKHLELELDEEKNSVELLTDRVTRSRDQIEQLRSELMQERSSKQDLELDKNALERQIKELKSRVAELDGLSRGSASASHLEARLQELEERLRNEEREKNSALSSQRRLERKLKELNITLDEERQQLSEQRDQLALRVKALKRQVDEGEEEVERLEGLRRKAFRDMEEQLEQKEALQARAVALETELKRKIQQARHIAMDSLALSSEEEDDDESLYDPSSITSILTEGSLQTSSC